MKSALVLKTALCSLLALSLLLSGCAYTTVTRSERIPQPGHDVPAGLAAVLVPLQDQRVWPGQTSSNPIPNVRMYAPEMTEAIRQGLLRRGLFSQLAKAGEPAAKGMPNQLRIDLKEFMLTNLGNNAWVVPHLLLDGALLPVFTAAMVGTQGKVDMGGYLIPSTRMGTTFNAKVTYREAGFTAPVLERDYLVKVELEQVSERKLLKSVSEGERYGVEIGKEQGQKTLDLFVQTVASDARWAFLPQFRRLVKAEALIKESSEPAKQIAAARELLDLVKPLSYTEEEIKVLRDGYLDAGPRANIVNEMRAQWLNLPGAKDVPREHFISEQRAEELFNDPSLYRAEVESVLAERALGIMVQVLTQDYLGKEEAPKLSQAQLDRLRQPLRQELVAKLKNQPRLQSLLLVQADKAIGKAWAPMKLVLDDVGDPVVEKYLKKRS